LNAPYHNKALPPGTVLREWRLEEVLGVGGFGIVYRGQGVYFGEAVAIKEYFPSAISDRIDGTTVAPTDSSSEEIYELGRQKFLEEAKVLWNLSRPERHPNIASVRSLFEIHGTAYMVMDFENGVSLSQMLRDGKQFDEKSLLALIKPVAEGLARAHAGGVLHRDIKPANILVDDTGRPVLIDFGSARFESGQATNTKVTFYTPPYAAIEQYVKSYPQGPWTDIYALGVVMYQCVSGEKPPEVLERLHGGVGQDLSSRQWPGFSRTFTRAVDAAMAIRPAERPPTIADWLKLFDLPEETVDNEATRIGVPVPTAAPPAPPPKPAPAAKPPVTQKVQAAIKPPGKASGGRRATQLLLGSVAAIVLLAGVGAVISLRRPTGPTAPAPAVSPASPVAASQPLDKLLDEKMDAALAAATKAGRPQSETAALADAKDKLAALTATIKTGKPDPATQEQLNGIAAQIFHSESAALGRAEKRLWSNLSLPPDSKPAPDAAQTIASLNQAKAGLDAVLTSDLTKADAVQAADATRQALIDFGALQDAYALAAPYYADAKRKAFATLYGSAQAVAAQVTALANVSKPWLLASRARKTAYQLRQDNATEAKTVMAPLDQTAAALPKTNDLRQLDTALTQAAAAKKTLDALLASSSAAQL
jgi:serine/threonine protein kinase